MATGVKVVDRNVTHANVWLNELTGEIPGTDKEEAWHYLRAVLHTLRDRLGNHEAAAFAAQLPTLMRGLFFEAWRPAETPHKWRHKKDYFAALYERLGHCDDIDIEQAVRAVLKVVGRHIGAAEMEKIKAMHNKEMWDLWPAPTSVVIQPELG